MTKEQIAELLEKMFPDNPKKIKEILKSFKDYEIDLKIALSREIVVYK